MTKFNENLVLGIDVGYARLGVGAVEIDGSSMRHVFHDCLETPKEDDYVKRILWLKKELVAILEKYQPKIAVVEDIFFFKNQKTAVKVSQIRGVILLVLAEAGVKIVTLTPLEIKSGVTGYGRADKKQVQEMVKMILSLKKIPKPDDAADALAAAISGSNYLNDFLEKEE